MRISIFMNIYECVYVCIRGYMRLEEDLKLNEMNRNNFSKISDPVLAYIVGGVSPSI